MTIQHLSDGSLNPGWIKERQGKLGASKVDEILHKGVGGKPSKMRTTLAKQLAAERLTGYSCNNVSPNNPDILRGNEMEPIALAEYEIKTGALLSPARWVEHPELPFSGCTPDSFTHDGGLVQVKAPRHDKYISLVLAGEVPEEYIPQITWEQAVCRAPWTDLVLYCREMPEGKRMWVKRFVAEETAIADMEEQVKLFLAEVEFIFDTITKMEFI